MADWQDTGDGFARNAAGQEVPMALLPPGERVIPAPAAAPAPMGPPAAPAMPSGPASPLSAQSVLAKLDEPSIAAARGQSEMPIAQRTTVTQDAIPMSTLKPVMDRRTRRAGEQGQAAIALGEEKSRIGEQQAMTASTAAYGQMQQSQAEADMHAQNAEIARQSELAVAMQKDPELEAGRYISNMTTGQSIGTVILAAIEGAFRGMTGQAGQSGVVNILEKRIEQDIMAQKEQIQSGRIRKGNTLAALRNMGMSEEAAEKGARAMAYAKAEQLTQSELARIGAGVHRAEGAALAEQLKVTAEQANDDWLLSIGTPRSSTTTVRAPAATGGGDPLMRALQADKLLEEQGFTREQRASMLSAAGMPTPGGQTAAERSGAGKGDLSEAQGKAQSAVESIDAFAKSAGLVRDPSTGKWKTGTGIVPPALLEKLNPLSDNAIASQFEAAVEAYGRLQSGGVIGDAEREAFRQQLGADTTTRDQLAERLNAASTALAPRQAERAKTGTTAEAAGFKRVAK